MTSVNNYIFQGFNFNPEDLLLLKDQFNDNYILYYLIYPYKYSIDHFFKNIFYGDKEYIYDTLNKFFYRNTNYFIYSVNLCTLIKILLIYLTEDDNYKLKFIYDDSYIIKKGDNTYEEYKIYDINKFIKIMNKKVPLINLIINDMLISINNNKDLTYINYLKDIISNFIEYKNFLYLFNTCNLQINYINNPRNYFKNNSLIKSYNNLIKNIPELNNDLYLMIDENNNIYPNITKNTIKLIVIPKGSKILIYNTLNNIKFYNENKYDEYIFNVNIVDNDIIINYNFPRDLNKNIIKYINNYTKLRNIKTFLYSTRENVNIVKFYDYNLHSHLYFNSQYKLAIYNYILDNIYDINIYDEILCGYLSNLNMITNKFKLIEANNKQAIYYDENNDKYYIYKIYNLDNILKIFKTMLPKINKLIKLLSKEIINNNDSCLVARLGGLTHFKLYYKNYLIFKNQIDFFKVPKNYKIILNNVIYKYNTFEILKVNWDMTDKRHEILKYLFDDIIPLSHKIILYRGDNTFASDKFYISSTFDINVANIFGKINILHVNKGVKMFPYFAFIDRESEIIIDKSFSNCNTSNTISKSYNCVLQNYP